MGRYREIQGRCREIVPAVDVLVGDARWEGLLHDAHRLDDARASELVEHLVRARARVRVGLG